MGEYIVKPFPYPDYHIQSKELTEAKKTAPFLKSGNAQAMQQTLRKLDRAFNDMKSKNMGFPRYKKKMKSFNLISKSLEINGNYLKMPQLKNVKLRKSRDIPEGFKIKQVQIIKKASGYYAGLMIQLDVDVPAPIPHDHAVGIDVGIKSMLATSDGLVISRPKFLDKARRKIKLTSDPASPIGARERASYCKESLKIKLLALVNGISYNIELLYFMKQ